MKTASTNNNQNKELITIRSRSLKLGSIVAILIAISPYIFYLYESFPDQPVWETFLFTFESKYQGSVYYSMWIFLNKLVPILLLTLWFFTCKHWWYHVILIPLSMYVFQFFSSLNEELQYWDEFEIYYVIPIMMIVIPFVYLIRIKLVDKYVNKIDLKKIDKELSEYESKDFIRKFYQQKEEDNKVSA